jgi:hypothetical protein
MDGSRIGVFGGSYEILVSDRHFSLRCCGKIWDERTMRTLADGFLVWRRGVIGVVVLEGGDCGCFRLTMWLLGWKLGSCMEVLFV